MSPKGKLPPRRKAPISLISLGLMAVVLITMIILVSVPRSNLVKNSPVVAIVDSQGNVPNLSLHHTLDAAGPPQGGP